MSEEINFIEMIRAARAGAEYLSYIDFEPGKTYKLKIEKVIHKAAAKSSFGKVEKNVYFLKFEKTEKQLWLSLGKLKRLGEILGRDVSKWQGQTIALVADSKVRFKGEEVGGLVIKEVRK